MKPAIEIRALGKKYPLRTQAPYLSLRESLSPSRFSRKLKRSDFWALEDIDLDVHHGDRLGIIGKNGAGKSTLLKILSRITWPTKGEATVRGKLTSLLEVGTGFHPELTGRENVWLNGAILGLKKKEIQKHFDSIVDFSGVEKFIDTPLKNYSSGMQLRLAFAVAAHLEPDVLIIDEVLAVGDAEFQKKCLGKIKEVSNDHGRTVLLVSHNMNHISSFCNKAILLSDGKLAESGHAGEVIASYITAIEQRSANYIWPENKRPGNDIVRLHTVRVIDDGYQTKLNYSTTEKIGIEMTYEVLKENHVLWLGHSIVDKLSINVFDTHNVNTEYYDRSHATGMHRSVVWIPPHLLNTGTYYVGCAIFNHLQNTIHLEEKDSVLFKMHDPVDEMTAKGKSPFDFPGAVRPLLEWSIEKT